MALNLQQLVNQAKLQKIHKLSDAIDRIQNGVMNEITAMELQKLKAERALLQRLLGGPRLAVDDTKGI